MSGVHLNKKGVAQVERTGGRIAHLGINTIYSSPLERTRETAEILQRYTNVSCIFTDELLEIDYGEWTGKMFDDLNGIELWRLYNTARSRVGIPGGEMMIEVQGRIAGFVESLRRKHDSGKIVIVSHGDPIKTLICYYAGISLDCMTLFDVATASVSIVSIDAWGAHVQCINDTGRYRIKSAI